MATRHRQTDKINETFVAARDFIRGYKYIHVSTCKDTIRRLYTAVYEKRSTRGVTSTEHTRFHWNFGNGRVHRLSNTNRNKRKKYSQNIGDFLLCRRPSRSLDLTRRVLKKKKKEKEKKKERREVDPRILRAILTSASTKVTVIRYSKVRLL